MADLASLRSRFLIGFWARFRGFTTKPTYMFRSPRTTSGNAPFHSRAAALRPPVKTLLEIREAPCRRTCLPGSSGGWHISFIQDIYLTQPMFVLSAGT